MLASEEVVPKHDDVAVRTAVVSSPGVLAHSTRDMAMSWSLFRGVSVEDICAAAQSVLTAGILNQGLSLP